MAATKEDLHKLIDTTHDAQLLEEIFMILSSRKDYQEGSLWNGLSAEQKQQVLSSEGELEDQSAWLSHDEMLKRNSEWLR